VKQHTLKVNLHKLAKQLSVFDGKLCWLSIYQNSAEKG